MLSVLVKQLLNIWRVNIVEWICNEANAYTMWSNPLTSISAKFHTIKEFSDLFTLTKSILWIICLKYSYFLLFGMGHFQPSKRISNKHR